MGVRFVTNRSAARRLSGMRFHQDVVMVEADDLLIGAGGHVRAHVAGGTVKKSSETRVSR